MKRTVLLAVGSLLLIVAVYLLIFDQTADVTTPSTPNPVPVGTSPNAEGSRGDGEASASNPANSESSETSDRPIGSTQTTQQIPLDLPAQDSKEATADAIADWLISEGWLTSADDLDTLVGGGNVGSLEIERVQQTHEGIPIYQSNLVVLKQDGRVISIEGALAVDINLNLDPTISIEDALAAEQARQMDETLRVAIEGPQLFIHQRSGASHLVWRIERGVVGDLYDVLIDAHSGERIREVKRGISG
jgi:Zn-dependent metalloprotease